MFLLTRSHCCGVNLASGKMFPDTSGLCRRLSAHCLQPAQFRLGAYDTLRVSSHQPPLPTPLNCLSFRPLPAGAVFPLEMHIVHFILPDQLPACGQIKGFPGCPVVLGIMFALTDNEDDVKPELRRLVEAMPRTEGRNATIAGELDVGALLPDNRTYMTYEGSLTTPPCRWIEPGLGLLGGLWGVVGQEQFLTLHLQTPREERAGRVGRTRAAWPHTPSRRGP